ncbi:hypothetical protein CCACVL1_29197 [Corchorus capsularis]|uniref:Uncharacterized protein n=1 Tax=Corchorus capsularis TaxID=210143 RepID=A0A1R3G356_COCAP|nr:hypothetical protein CCACVL1_29197 [Corchorus capsularis]
MDQLLHKIICLACAYGYTYGNMDGMHGDGAHDLGLGCLWVLLKSNVSQSPLSKRSFVE